MYNQLTEKDIQAMEAEIEDRKLNVRPKLLEAVKEARAQGDLSENFEYYAAKKEKNKNESRIRFLERMIKTAEIIPDDSGEDEIGVNTRVTVQFEDDGDGRAADARHDDRQPDEKAQNGTLAPGLFVVFDQFDLIIFLSHRV